MLTATNISAGYGGKSAVESISFTLSEGQWLMICGPNGAGKSTLMKAVTGVLPCTGEVLIAGRDMRHMRPAELAREVGVLSQRTHSEYDFTVEQVVALGRYAHRGSFLRPSDSAGAAKITEALTAVGLLEKRTRPLGALSGGEVQRVFLAQVFAQEPRILILDEPANHLDVTYQKQLFDLINDWRPRTRSCGHHGRTRSESGADVRHARAAPEQRPRSSSRRDPPSPDPRLPDRSLQHGRSLLAEIHANTMGK